MTPCGPTYISHRETQIIWPEFLRRTSRIRIVLPDNPWAYYSDGVQTCEVSVLSNTVYSLACFLATDNRLRHCSIDFDVVPSSQRWPENLHNLRLKSTTLPLRLLGLDVQLKVPAQREDRVTLSRVTLSEMDDIQTVRFILYAGTAPATSRLFGQATSVTSTPGLLLTVFMFMPLVVLMACMESLTGHVWVEAWICRWYGPAA